jgi:hypothetical protein
MNVVNLSINTRKNLNRAATQRAVVAKGATIEKFSSSEHRVREIDRAFLASVTLEGSCHDFFRTEWRSIGRKSKATEPSKGSIEAEPATRGKRNRSLYRAFLANGFHPQTHRPPSLSPHPESYRYRRISVPTRRYQCLATNRFDRSCVRNEILAGFLLHKVPV